jgi:hypothetical protein
MVTSKGKATGESKRKIQQNFSEQKIVQKSLYAHTFVFAGTYAYKLSAADTSGKFCRSKERCSLF